MQPKRCGFLVPKGRQLFGVCVFNLVQMIKNMHDGTLSPISPSKEAFFQCFRFHLTTRANTFRLKRAKIAILIKKLDRKNRKKV